MSSTHHSYEQPRRKDGRFAPGVLNKAPTPAPAIPHLPETGTTPKAEWEYRYHLTFANFHSQTLAETKRLFRSRPSQLNDTKRRDVFTLWVDKTSAAYNMEPPRIYWDEEADYAGGGYYRMHDHSITLSPNRPSITTLLHEFRHALQSKECGPKLVSKDLEIDARAWSLSLYYQCRPRLFQRLVEEGRILHINQTAFSSTR